MPEIVVTPRKRPPPPNKVWRVTYAPRLKTAALNAVATVAATLVAYPAVRYMWSRVFPDNTALGEIVTGDHYTFTDLFATPWFGIGLSVFLLLLVAALNVVARGGERFRTVTTAALSVVLGSLYLFLLPAREHHNLNDLLPQTVPETTLSLVTIMCVGFLVTMMWPQPAPLTKHQQEAAIRLPYQWIPELTYAGLVLVLLGVGLLGLSDLTVSENEAPLDTTCVSSVKCDK